MSNIEFTRMRKMMMGEGLETRTVSATLLEDTTVQLLPSLPANEQYIILSITDSLDNRRTQSVEWGYRDRASGARHFAGMGRKGSYHRAITLSGCPWYVTPGAGVDAEVDGRLNSIGHVTIGYRINVSSQ